MIHENRVFQVARVDSADELAAKLSTVGRTWTLCSGFEFGGLLFLNDSFSEDGAQEYAVLKDGRQVESVTFGWCTKARAVQIIEALVAGDALENLGKVRARLDRSLAHRCRFCA